jgi:DNA modification methylase
MIEIGDCRDIMRRWASEGVKSQTCVTSPPYFGLRDYGHPGQIGLEQTPDEYIAAMVEVFRCVRDVLADDGTLWLNIGDSYNNFRSTMGPGQAVHGRALRGKPAPESKARGVQGLKEKDLIGIPWMLAFALRADGWYLRQDIIWHKPNPMPESVRDRCTKAHEYIFLMSKSERYFFDSEAMQEDAICGSRGSEFHTGKTSEHQLGRASKKPRESKVRGEFNGKTNEMPGREAFRAVRETRNRRSVWTVATKSYSGAHFATYPPALIEPCILAGSRPGDTVLDPFMGSGTTAQVAQDLGRNAIGCELNPQYLSLQRERTAQMGLML